MKQRGSALVFVLAMVFSITSMVLVTAAMTRSVNDRTETVHRAAQEKLSLTGSAAFITAKSNDDSVLTAMNYTVNIADQNYTVRAMDHSALIKQTYAVSAAGNTRTKTTGMTAMTGTRRTSHPLYYALWTGGDLGSLTSVSLTVPTANGFVYASRVPAAGTFTLGSDLTYATTTTLLTHPYGEVEQATEKFFPFSVGDYAAASPTLLTKASQMNLVLGNLSGAYYPVFYAAAPLNLRGTISGTGTVVVNGDLTITQDLTYLSAGDRCVFIVNGNLTISGTAPNVAGYFYVNGNVILQGASLRSFPRTNIACNAGLTYEILSITPDPYFLQNQSECAKYRLPGFWPVADPKLIRL